MKFNVVLLNGQRWQCLLNSLELSLMWAAIKSGKVKTIIVPAWNESGIPADLDIRRVDPDRSFGDVVYERTSVSSVPPPKAA